MKEYIPIAHSISSWDDRKEVFYECPKCRTDFRILGKRNKYCFNCGVKIDWDVITKLRDSVDSLYNEYCNKGNTDMSQYEFEKALIRQINATQGVKK